MSNFTYLLDTNILSDLVRHPAGKIMQRIKAVGEARICTSVVVAAELRFGSVQKRITAIDKASGRCVVRFRYSPLWNNPPMRGMPGYVQPW